MDDPTSRGFTFIEILITCIIMGLIAVFAYPSYHSYILKAHRADAKIALLREKGILEHCFAETSAYNAPCKGLLDFPHHSPQAYYLISLSNVSANTYTLTARAIGSQIADIPCQQFVVQQNDSLQGPCWD